MSLREGTGVSAGSSSRSKSAVIVTSPESAAWPIIGSSALLLVDDIRLENNKAGSQLKVILTMILPLLSGEGLEEWLQMHHFILHIGVLNSEPWTSI